MAVYKLNDTCKTLEKLFKKGYKSLNEIKKVEWEKLSEFTPFEKSLIMDFKVAAKHKKIVEFLAGVEYERKEE